MKIVNNRTLHFSSARQKMSEDSYDYNIRRVTRLQIYFASVKALLTPVHETETRNEQFNSSNTNERGKLLSQNLLKNTPLMQIIGPIHYIIMIYKYEMSNVAQRCNFVRCPRGGSTPRS